MVDARASPEERRSTARVAERRVDNGIVVIAEAARGGQRAVPARARRRWLCETGDELAAHRALVDVPLDAITAGARRTTADEVYDSVFVDAFRRDRPPLSFMLTILALAGLSNSAARRKLSVEPSHCDGRTYLSIELARKYEHALEDFTRRHVGGTVANLAGVALKS